MNSNKTKNWMAVWILKSLVYGILCGFLWFFIWQMSCCQLLVRIRHLSIIMAVLELQPQTSSRCVWVRIWTYCRKRRSLLWFLSGSLMTLLYISYLMTGWLILYAAIFACQIFMGKDYTHTHRHAFTLRVANRSVRNNFPWTPTALCSSLAHCPGISQ